MKGQNIAEENEQSQNAMAAFYALKSQQQIKAEHSKKDSVGQKQIA